MSDKPYYFAYENRYRKVYQAGIECWGHTPDDEILCATLKSWVEKNKLRGKRIIEFACGEGASGVILSQLGCIYKGVDISPSAVGKAKAAVKPFPGASVSLLDMVNDKVEGEYDAALDSMGYHMLVLDCDRKKYLQNAFDCLSAAAPMLFFRQSFRQNAPDEETTSFEQWKAITGDDYDTPQVRIPCQNGAEMQVSLPLVPARARNRQGYKKEMREVGFVVDEIIDMNMSLQIPYSVSIYVHKSK